MIRLLGVFDVGVGLGGARAIRGEVDIIDRRDFVSNVRIAPDFAEDVVSLLPLMRLTAAIFGSPDSPLQGISLDFFDPPDQALADTSYGLPICTAAVLAAAGLPLDESVAGTGRVTSEGRLRAVEGLRVKAAAAAADGAVAFAFPAEQAIELGTGIPLSTLLGAVFLWTDLSAFERALSCAESPESVLRSLRAFLEGQGGARYVDGTGRMVRRLFRDRPILGEAFANHQGEWQATALSQARMVPEWHFDDLLELIDPRYAFQELREDPDRLEEMIAQGIRALATLPRASAREAVRAVAALIRTAAAGMDLSMLIRGPRVLNALGALQALVDRAVPDDPHIRADFSEIQQLYQIATRISSGEIVPPEAAAEAPLTIRPVYSDARLVSLEFHTRGGGGPATGSIPFPAALLDRSEALPSGLRTRDWSHHESAMDRLPNAAAVSRAFGRRTVFQFAHPVEPSRPEVNVLWGDGSGTWPPSIDSLHLVGTMARHGFYDATARFPAVLDLGCGTGIHGIALAKWSQVRRLDLLDAELGARLTATTNVLANFTTTDRPRPVPFMAGAELLQTEECRVQLLGHDAPRWLEGLEEPYDLTICTPPYVPFVSVLGDPSMWRAVAGTDLLRFTLSNWKAFTRRLVIQFSEIALDEISDVLPRGSPVSVELVGFRIPPLLRYFDPNDPSLAARGEDWRELVGGYLLEAEDEPTLTNRHHGFRYFHRIRTYILES